MLSFVLMYFKINSVCVGGGGLWAYAEGLELLMAAPACVSNKQTR